MSSGPLLDERMITNDECIGHASLDGLLSGPLSPKNLSRGPAQRRCTKVPIKVYWILRFWIRYMTYHCYSCMSIVIIYILLSNINRYFIDNTTVLPLGVVFPFLQKFSWNFMLAKLHRLGVDILGSQFVLMPSAAEAPNNWRTRYVFTMTWWPMMIIFSSSPTPLKQWSHVSALCFLSACKLLIRKAVDNPCRIAFRNSICNLPQLLGKLTSFGFQPW